MSVGGLGFAVLAMAPEYDEVGLEKRWPQPRRSPDAAQHEVMRCRSGVHSASANGLRTVPALRSSAKSAAPRPGHERPMPSPRVAADLPPLCASAVISAPASMRAISSRRWSAASALTRVATRLPLSSASLEISRCWLARAATCGAWVTAITWTLPARRASRAPMASATAPPTPVSISSNTSVGAEPLSDSTTFSASRKRDSSPPEATFIIGPALVPGLVWTQNSTRSKPCGPGDFGSNLIGATDFARSSFSGASSAFTALLSFSADFVRTAESLAAAAP